MAKTLSFLFLGVCLFLIEAGGQNPRAIDSLKKVLQTKTGGDRYPPLYDLAFEYLDIDNEKALEFIQQAEAAALLSGDSLWIVKSMRVKGQILSKLERTADAIPAFESAIAIATRNNFRHECLMVFNSAGTIYLYRSQFDKALEKFRKAFEYAEEESDTAYLSSCLNNIGATYFHISDFTKALNYLLRGVEMSETMKRPVDYYVFINISLCYIHLKEFSTAEVYLGRALAACGGVCSDRAMIHTKFASGLISNGLEKYDLALEEFRSSYHYAQKLNDSRFMLDNISLLSGILIHENRLKEAGAYFDAAEQIIKKGAPFPQTILNLYSKRSELFLKMKRYKELAAVQQEYIHLKDSIYSDQLTTRLMTVESEFRERENKAKIEAQNEIILLKEQVISRQEVLNTVTGLLALITLVFAVFVFRNFIRKKDLNVALERKIRERTIELESSRDELLKVINEKDLRIARASGLIWESVNTIEGLCFTASKDLPDPVSHSYLRRIRLASTNCAGNIQAIFQGDRLIASAQKFL